MANNRIQIKRSAATATPTSLLPGELAFSNVTGGSGVLFIGDTSNTAVVAIGGVRNPGTLTANQALVANSTSAINQVIVGNVAFTGTSQSIQANGTVGTAGFVLASGGTGSNLYWVSTGSFSTNVADQYVWTNTHTFQNTVTFGANLVVDATSVRWVGNTTTSPTATLANTGAFTIGNSSTTQTTSTISVANSTGNVQITPGTTSILATGVVNASSFGVGTIGTGTGGSVQNTTTVFVGNNTVNTVLTSAGLNVNGSAVVANSTGLWTTGTVNAASHTVGAVFVANTTTLNANGLVVNSTGAYVSGLTNSTSFNAGATGTGTGGSVQNTTTMFVGNNTVNTVITSAGLSVNGTATVANSTGVYTGVVNGSSITVGTNFIANTTKVTFTGANIDASSAFLRVADAIVSGNLVVSGSVVAINVASLTVNDNIIQLGFNNITTDVVDTGWFSPAGNASNIWYSGLVRQASKSSNSNPYFWLFGSNTNPNTAATVDTSANTTTGTLQAFLVPYGTGGAFVANSAAVTITANSTVNVNITANSLTLSTPLAGTSGGTGRSSWTNQDLLVANATNGVNALALNTTAGYVLQTNGTAIVYDWLDGGTF